MSLRKLFANHYLLSLIILGAFLATNRYIYGWDDQALEIPLLKHLIDPELYAGDYYVESLRQNFSSYMYPLLAKVLSVGQIPAAYLVLYVLSRYVFFLFSLKLWRFVSGSTLTAVAAVLMSFWIGRTEEFLYRTFSHQEFALAIIVAGLYFLYRDRTLWAAALFGIAANFNALYALLPMLYLGTCLLLGWQWKRIFAAGAAFTACALPFLCWVLPKKFGGEPPATGLYDGWMDLFLLACPQNFLFQTTPLTEVFSGWKSALPHLGPYLFLLVLYLFNVIFNEPFRRSRQSQAVCLCGTGLIMVSFIFTYLIPNRLVIDLNLIRNLQYINFVLMGYTTWWICREAASDRPDRAYLAALALFFLSYRDMVGAAGLAGLAAALIMTERTAPAQRTGARRWVFGLIPVAVAVVLFLVLDRGFGLEGTKFRIIASAAGLLTGAYLVTLICPAVTRSPMMRGAWAGVPLTAAAIYFGILHYNFVKVSTTGGGFWQLQRNWEEMQYFVRDNTPKDALLMVPYNMEMGGFRIGSERSIIVSYRDCGIVGFDYPALKEWQQRVADLKHFKVIPDGPLQPAIVNGLGKYRADYIIFTRFAAPKSSNQTLTKLHENELFTLFRVNRTRP
ncbi:MAG: hypothetical protein H6756_12700 [Candidatus Omnitrophica bacterium]|nr:hypothetical protein [Candidatus Omnitrophota bacterium]